MSIAADAPEQPTHRHLVAVCVALVVGGALVAALIVLRARSIIDEGEYLYNGWAVFRHGWRPFADFHTRTLPLIYYVYGWPQALLGGSVLVGRIQALLMSAAGVGLSCLLARRLGGAWAVPLVLGLVAFNFEPGIRYYRALAMAPTGLLLILALVLVVGRRLPVWRLYAGSICAAGVVLCRHDMAPAAGVIWLYIWWRHCGCGGHRWGAPLIGVIALVAISAGFRSSAPEQFDAIVLQGVTSPGKIVGGPYASWAEPRTFSSFAWHVLMCLRIYSGAALLLVGALALHLWRRGQPAASVTDDRIDLWVVAAVAGANYLAHLGAIVAMGFRQQYLIDLYILFPVIAWAAAGFARAVRDATLSPNTIRASVAFAAVAILVPLALNRVPPDVHLSGLSDLERIAAGAEVIAREVPPDALVFCPDDPHQLLEAERLTFPPLTWQLFLFTESTDTALVRRQHYYNREIIDGWMSREAEYAVIGDGLVDWMVNSGRYDGGEQLRSFIFERLERDYMPLDVAPDGYMGPTRIYRYVGSGRQSPGATLPQRGSVDDQ